jgi:hypothetical protein
MFAAGGAADAVRPLDMKNLVNERRLDSGGVFIGRGNRGTTQEFP